MRLSLALAAAPPEPPPLPAVTVEPEHLDISALPVLAYDPDDGFGTGVTGGLYWLSPGLDPYKVGLQGGLYFTTRNAHWDRVVLDWLRVADTPLRLMAVALFSATRTDIYCGLGNAVQCSEAAASRAAESRGLTGEARDGFVNDYYYRRYLSYTGELKAFYPLATDPARFELTLSWRGNYYQPGEIGQLSVYPGSLYAQRFPRGEPGLVSLLQAGLMVDARDNEPAPTTGYWADFTVRAALPSLGSDWRFYGANLTLREYLPVTSDHGLVWANRTIVDAILGDPPVVELSQIGGYSRVPGGLQGFGGGDVGRGVNQNTFVGRIKILHQSELRWTFLAFTVLGERFDMGAVAFVDLGWIGVDYDHFGGDPRKVNTSEGVGGRLAWDKNFIGRVDLGFSEAKGFSPFIYLDVNNIF
ncbi:MAG TPA: BamA/TamA family outer membrane protein [Myxococcota bacterium]|nr:BamA/TamA family outer membrane protein [Myxococcota bacterium]